MKKTITFVILILMISYVFTACMNQPSGQSDNTSTESDINSVIENSALSQIESSETSETSEVSELSEIALSKYDKNKDGEVYVAFFGNSFIYVNDIPARMKNMASQLGIKLHIDDRSLPGPMISQHLSHFETGEYDDAIESAEIVILQTPEISAENYLQKATGYFKNQNVEFFLYPFMMQYSECNYYRTELPSVCDELGITWLFTGEIYWRLQNECENKPDLFIPGDYHQNVFLATVLAEMMVCQIFGGDTESISWDGLVSDSELVGDTDDKKAAFKNLAVQSIANMCEQIEKTGMPYGTNNYDLSSELLPAGFPSLHGLSVYKEENVDDVIKIVLFCFFTDQDEYKNNLVNEGFEIISYNDQNEIIFKNPNGWTVTLKSVDEAIRVLSPTGYAYEICIKKT